MTPEEIQALRQMARERGDFVEADRLRRLLWTMGYVVRDTATGSVLRPVSPFEKRQGLVKGPDGT